MTGPVFLMLAAAIAGCLVYLWLRLDVALDRRDDWTRAVDAFDELRRTWRRL